MSNLKMGSGSLSSMEGALLWLCGIHTLCPPGSHTVSFSFFVPKLKSSQQLLGRQGCGHSREGQRQRLQDSGALCGVCCLCSRQEQSWTNAHEWTQCQSRQGKTHCGSDRTRGAERGCCRASLRAEHSPEVPCPTTAGPHFSAGSQHMREARSHSSINTCTAAATVGAEVWNAEHTWVLDL